MPGTRGRFPKPNAVRSRRNVIAIDGGRASPKEIPKPPAGLLARSKELWVSFFESPVASALEPSDMGAVERWVSYVDEWQRVTKTLKQTGLITTGSAGQLRLSPLSDRQLRLEAAIANLESQLGLTLLSRLRLGLLYGRAQLTAADLNAINAEQTRRSYERDRNESWAAGFIPTETNGGNNE